MLSVVGDRPFVRVEGIPLHAVCLLLRARLAGEQCRANGFDLCQSARFLGLLSSVRREGVPVGVVPLGTIFRAPLLGSP